MGDKPTRAEQFWQADSARKVARPMRLGTVFEVKKAFPAAQLMQSGATCTVDDAIRAALDRGFLVGAFEAIRTDLAVVCALAWGAAGAAYAQQLAEQSTRDRKKVAKKLSADLQRFLESVRGEAYDMDNVTLKAECHTETADLHAMVEHGEAFLELLDAYSRPASVACRGPATDHLRHEFFSALNEWWRSHAVDPGRRGANAIRGRLALGLWHDMGQKVPEGYADEDFASRSFRNTER